MRSFVSLAQPGGQIGNPVLAGPEAGQERIVVELAQGAHANAPATRQ